MAPFLLLTCLVACTIPELIAQSNNVGNLSPGDHSRILSEGENALSQFIQVAEAVENKKLKWTPVEGTLNKEYPKGRLYTSPNDKATIFMARFRVLAPAEMVFNEIWHQSERGYTTKFNPDVNISRVLFEEGTNRVSYSLTNDNGVIEPREFYVVEKFRRDDESKYFIGYTQTAWPVKLSPTAVLGQTFTCGYKIYPFSGNPDSTTDVIWISHTNINVNLIPQDLLDQIVGQSINDYMQKLMTHIQDLAKREERRQRAVRNSRR